MLAEDKGRTHWTESEVVLESRGWRAWKDFSQALIYCPNDLCTTVAVT